ncbi:hypothetical protein, partial [Pseudooceanicola sp.]|uniref:hypothetical protein n=1 Tax=Pseudooceanicola sp. TaxID=1914328 RepID=UPI002615394A
TLARKFYLCSPLLSGGITGITPEVQVETRRPGLNEADTRRKKDNLNRHAVRQKPGFGIAQRILKPAQDMAHLFRQSGERRAAG